MKNPGVKRRTNIKGLAMVMAVILTIAEMVGTGWFIFNVLYGKPSVAGELAGSGRQSAQVDEKKVEAIFAAIEAKTSAPVIAEETIRNIRNPFKQKNIPVDITSSPPNAEVLPPTVAPPSTQ